MVTARVSAAKAVTALKFAKATPLTGKRIIF